MHRLHIWITTLLFALAAPAAAQEAEPPEIEWRAWNDELFELAEATGRHVLLDLNARWCHWCHFMEERTYAHPDVRDLVDRAYLAVKVDQDANPDLASRYGDWGWPATIVFAPDGREVAKLQGFQRPSRMAGILYTIVARPDQVPALLAEPKVRPSDSGALTEDQRSRLLALLDQTYDVEHAGWGMRLKFLQPQVIEYAMLRAQDGDAQFEARVRASLDAAMVLNDPVWGGMYQYSHERDWSAPHYEKIMAFQSGGISLYAKAYRQFGDPAYLDVAQSVAGYLLTHLRGPEGAFYTSQDADVNSTILGQDFYSLDHAGRMALGLQPTIDTNLYARENGWAATGLLDLYGVTGKAEYLSAAETALTWVLDNRALTPGGFAHGATDQGGPYLSDNVAMGQAMLKAYMATGDTAWLARAAQLADFIVATFRHPEAGFVTTRAPRVAAAAFAEPFVNVEENIDLARFANLLAHTHGAERFRDMALHAMGFLASEEVTQRRRFMLGTVLADIELASDPAHVTIVGGAEDPAADRLHQTALGLPLGYARIDRWDPATGPRFNDDIEYPALDQAAGFACANGVCSLPVFIPQDLRLAVERTMRGPPVQ